MRANTCKALFISSMASGQGKTTVTAGIARFLRKQSLKVKVFKTGPDYLDPLILEQASGLSVEPLDLWMAGEDYCRGQLFDASQNHDVLLIEGAMGLHDGEPSSADLAALFGIPVLVVINAKGMAQTTNAITYGLSQYQRDFTLSGFIINQIGSDRHRQLIEESRSDVYEMPRNVCYLKRAPDVQLPERHLGLVQPGDQSKEDLESRLEAAATWIETSEFPQWFFHQSDCEVTLREPFNMIHRMCHTQKPLSGVKIGIARDEAFSFIYSANCHLLEELGANISFFSPIHDSYLPEGCQSLWFPGGYPELHTRKLSENTSMMQEISKLFESNAPILAECGGMLYLQESLEPLSSTPHSMVGLLPGHGTMRGKRGCQGMQTAPLPEGDIRGHAHHRSRSSSTLEPLTHGVRQRHMAPGEPIYRLRRLTATYLHLFFPSNIEATIALFKPNL